MVAYAVWYIRVHVQHNRGGNEHGVVSCVSFSMQEWQLWSSKFERDSTSTSTCDHDACDACMMRDTESGTYISNHHGTQPIPRCGIQYGRIPTAILPVLQLVFLKWWYQHD